MLRTIEILTIMLLPWSAANAGFELALDRYGPEGFKNPGGWKLPVGEVVTLAAAVAGWLIVVAIGVIALRTGVTTS